MSIQTLLRQVDQENRDGLPKHKPRKHAWQYGGECQKIPFPTEQIAKTYAERHAKKYKKSSTAKGTYICPKCGRWHLTSQKSRKKK